MGGAVDELTLKLSSIQVKGFERRGRSGALEQVGAYNRNISTMGTSSIQGELGQLTHSTQTDPLDVARTRTRMRMLTNELAARERAARPLTDDEYQNHVKAVQDILAKPETLAQDTTAVHGIRDHNGDILEGHYSPERTQQHAKIVADILAAHQHVPNEGHAIMSGGQGGSGKGYILKHHAGVPDGSHMVIDPDMMKEELIKRGLSPNIKGLSPMESASLIHEESSHLANQLTKAAVQHRKNIVLDTTMASTKSTLAKAHCLKNHGYEVHSVFVDVPNSVSRQSALDRHRDGQEKYRQGQGHGGRYVPDSYLKQSAVPEGHTLPSGLPLLSKNAKSHEEARATGVFKSSRVYDNSRSREGVSPRLVYEDSGHTRGLTERQKTIYATRVNSGMSPKQARRTAQLA